MPREIKFRAYLPVGEWNEDGESQKYVMVGPDDLAFEDYEPISELLSKTENLMQFTGLRDKSGKEIYEGDILQDNTAYYATLVEWTSCGFKFRHILNAKGMMLKTKMPEYCGTEPDSSDSYQIIGNRWENPELLGDQTAGKEG